MAATLAVRDLFRSPQNGPEDRLTFRPGVNVLVGPPNTGKTKWLQTLDFLLGNDGAPEDVLGEEVAVKYESASAVLVVGREEITVERKWKEAKSRSKVHVNGEPVSIKEFLADLMGRLAIPVLHYPQGNPYGDRTWPELGWRSLYRHAYRRQTLWGDIADRQPESEQHACLLQFLGVAEHLFSEHYGQLVAKEKKIAQLQIARDQFMAMLHELSKELLHEQELGVAVSPQSIETAVRRVHSEIADLQRDRQAILTSLVTDGAFSHLFGGAQPTGRHAIEEMGEKVAQLQTEHESFVEAIRKTEPRLSEIRSYRASAEEELARLQRALQAGVVLADLKVTHCPACDEPIAPVESASDPATCYVCKRPTSDQSPSVATAQERLSFEVEQLQGELAEADQLIHALSQDLERLEEGRCQTAREVARLREMLRPVRTAAAAIMPPEIGVIDMKVGQLQERLQQLERVTQSLHRRKDIACQITEIQHEVADLEAQVREESGRIDFEQAGDSLSDGMNTYLNLIKQARPTSWTQAAVAAQLDDRKLRINVGDQRWQSKLGGTLTLYFLISYHYALMSLSNNPQCHYPGLLILDFPAELEDGSSVADKENFVVEPFVSLLQQPDYRPAQVIAAGVAFENLEGAHRIELSRIWK